MWHLIRKHSPFYFRILAQTNTKPKDVPSHTLCTSGIQLYFHAFFTLVLDADERLTSLPAPIYLRKWVPGTYLKGSLVVPTAGMDILEKKYPALPRINLLILDHPANISVTVRHTSRLHVLHSSKQIFCRILIIKPTRDTNFSNLFLE